QAGDEVLAELEHPRRQARQELPGAVPPIPEGGGDLDTPFEDTARDAAQEAVEAVPPLAGEVLEALERVRPPAAEQGFQCLPAGADEADDVVEPVPEPVREAGEPVLDAGGEPVEELLDVHERPPPVAPCQVAEGHAGDAHVVQQVLGERDDAWEAFPEPVDEAGDGGLAVLDEPARHPTEEVVEAPPPVGEQLAAGGQRGVPVASEDRL